MVIFHSDPALIKSTRTALVPGRRCLTMATPGLPERRVTEVMMCLVIRL